LLLTALPFIVIAVNTRLIKRIFGLKNLNFEDTESYISLVMFNLIDDLIYDVDSYLEELKINFKNDSFNLNPKDLSSIQLKNLFNMQGALKDAQRLTYGASIKIKTKLNSDCFLENILITTKPHISRFMVLSNGKIIFLNETSKDELCI